MYIKLAANHIRKSAFLTSVTCHRRRKMPKTFTKSIECMHRFRKKGTPKIVIAGIGIEEGTGGTGVDQLNDGGSV